MRCSRCAFIRLGGIIQVSARTSDQSASRASPDRQAHNVRNSKHSFVAGHALLARIFSTAAPTSPNGSARWCCTGWLFLGKAAMIASPAGLSGRNPCAMLHFMTAPIRCRTFLAVSRLVKIGANTFQTSAVPTSETSFSRTRAVRTFPCSIAIGPPPWGCANLLREH